MAVLAEETEMVGRGGRWMWALAMVACVDDAPEPITQTVAAEGSPTPEITPTAEGLLLPAVNFQLLPAEAHVGLGQTQSLVAANFGVPLETITFTSNIGSVDRGYFDPVSGIYSAPEASLPADPHIEISAKWVDAYGRTHLAKSHLTLTEWHMDDISGPGRSCGEDCQSRYIARSDGEIWVYRAPYGLWRSVAEIKPIELPEAGSEGECETPPIDPQEQTPPGGILTPTPLILTPEPTLTPIPTPVPTPALSPTPTPMDQSPIDDTPSPTPVSRTFIDTSGAWFRTGNTLAPDIEGLIIKRIPYYPQGLIAMGDGKIWRSPNGGHDWIEQALTGEVSALELYPEGQDQLVVATKIESEYYLGRSDDGGQLWKEWSTGLESEIRAIAVVPRLTSRILVATQNELWVSEDGGRQFRSTAAGFDAVHAIEAQLLGRAWAVVEQGARRLLMFSDTSGEVWEPYSGVPGCDPLKLTPDPQNPYYLWLTCMSGEILFSVDAGDNFQPFPAQLYADSQSDDPEATPPEQEVEIFPGQRPMARHSLKGIDSFYYWDEAEGQWFNFSAGPGPRITTMRAGRLYRPDVSSGRSLASPFPGLVVATGDGFVDGSVNPMGKFWVSHLNPVAAGARIRDLAFDERGEYALLATENGELWIAEGGIEATYTAQALPEGAELQSVEMQAGDENRWWAVARLDGQSTVYEGGAGVELNALGQVEIERIRQVNAEDSTLAGWGSGRLFSSVDGGSEWLDISLGEAASDVMKVHDQTVLLGGSGGIFASHDAGQSFEALGFAQSPVEALCRVAPRDEKTENETVKAGVAGYMAYGQGAGLGVRHDNLDFFSEIDLQWPMDDEGERLPIVDLEPALAHPGSAYALIESRGLYLIAPAPVVELPEPGQYEGDGSGSSGENCP